jgi:hypothetical protein
MANAQMFAPEREAQFMCSPPMPIYGSVAQRASDLSDPCSKRATILKWSPFSRRETDARAQRDLRGTL